MSDPAGGLARMRALAAELPAQLEQGFRAGRDLDVRLPREARVATVVGMGGSAIAADLLSAITAPETDLAIDVARGPVLARGVDARSVAILTSYSGNTWETLAAYDEAGRRGATRVAVSSGGELARRAESDAVPHLQLPPGLPPRAATGHMLGGLLGLLDPFFPESNEARLTRIARRLAEGQRALTSRTGGPARLAKRVGPRTPLLYADQSLLPLARRWKTQVEENAKRLAHFDAMPELLHNAIVAWDAIARPAARRLHVILLEWPGQNPTVAKGFDYLGSLLKRRGVGVDRVAFDAEDRLEALLTGLSYGDHFSLALAEAARADPLDIEPITRLKRALEHA